MAPLQFILKWSPILSAGISSRYEPQVFSKQLGFQVLPNCSKYSPIAPNALLLEAFALVTLLGMEGNSHDLGVGGTGLAEAIKLDHPIPLCANNVQAMSEASVSNPSFKKLHQLSSRWDRGGS